SPSLTPALVPAAGQPRGDRRARTAGEGRYWPVGEALRHMPQAFPSLHHQHGLRHQLQGVVPQDQRRVRP
ncbi:unnamed protein product, partial [Ectocarpus sp. 8 AP-2014]